MRQTSPLSPAIHLGANRLLVVGVGDMETDGLGLRNPKAEPTFGQMFGFMLDSLFMDQLHSDLELIKSHNENNHARRIEALVITPSKDLGEIARRHRHELPPQPARVAADDRGEQRRRHAALELPAVRARLHAGTDRTRPQRCAARDPRRSGPSSRSRTLPSTGTHARRRSRFRTTSAANRGASALAGGCRGNAPPSARQCTPNGVGRRCSRWRW